MDERMAWRASAHVNLAGKMNDSEESNQFCSGVVYVSVIRGGYAVHKKNKEFDLE